MSPRPPTSLSTKSVRHISASRPKIIAPTSLTGCLAATAAAHAGWRGIHPSEKVFALGLRFPFSGLRPGCAAGPNDVTLPDGLLGPIRV